MNGRARDGQGADAGEKTQERRQHPPAATPVAVPSGALVCFSCAKSFAD
jgi:hypothetical protein